MVTWRLPLEKTKYKKVIVCYAVTDCTLPVWKNCCSQGLTESVW